MSTYTRISTIMICTFALGLSACGGGGGGKSANTRLRILPEKPIVILGPTKDQAGQDIDGPWFEFGMEVTNNTDETITVKALVAEVTAQDETGQFVTGTATWAATQVSKTVLIAGEDFSCTYTNFGEIAPLATEALVLDNGVAQCLTAPRFTVGSNESGVNGSNFRYRVKVKPLGWFGTDTNPSDRFEKSVTFFTQ